MRAREGADRAAVPAARLPVVGTLIAKIAARKKRDNLILAGVIAVGIIILLLFTLA